MLKGKKILIAVTGSIAAYKIPMLVRLLVKDGADVKVILTEAAKSFVSPLTLSTLTKQDVLSDLSAGDTWANHVMLGRWADVMLIAPLSCNTLAKMAAGFCDNLLLAVYLSATCPVIVAPAMDEDMWHHFTTKNNIDILALNGVQIIPVESGELASGLIGEGRMAEIEVIAKWLQHFFLKNSQFKGKKVLVTAGPTYEALDPVRFIGNHSSGKMGLAIANNFLRRGADVTLVMGPNSLKVPDSIKLLNVTSAEEMYNACITAFPDMDIAVMSAAVADYTPVTVVGKKIKKQENNFSLELKRTKDILKQLGLIKKKGQFLVGFALETNNEKQYALKKLSEKNADLIVLNSLNDAGAGFGHDTNKITIFDKNQQEYHFEVKSKEAVAADIVDIIFQSQS